MIEILIWGACGYVILDILLAFKYGKCMLPGLKCRHCRRR